jgi:hypothetical protein
MGIPVASGLDWLVSRPIVNMHVVLSVCYAQVARIRRNSTFYTQVSQQVRILEANKTGMHPSELDRLQRVGM